MAAPAQAVAQNPADAGYDITPIAPWPESGEWTGGIDQELLGFRGAEAIAAYDACLTVAVSSWPPEWVNQLRAWEKELRSEIDRRAAKLLQGA
jgi:hypothetical protein